jgi:hypothetical protein
MSEQMNSDDRPYLGLATTQELLDELMARLALPLGHEVSEGPAIERVLATRRLRCWLPQAALEYRPADSGLLPASPAQRVSATNLPIRLKPSETGVAHEKMELMTDDR